MSKALPLEYVTRQLFSLTDLRLGGSLSAYNEDSLWRVINSLTKLQRLELQHLFGLHRSIPLTLTRFRKLIFSQTVTEGLTFTGTSRYLKEVATVGEVDIRSLCRAAPEVESITCRWTVHANFPEFKHIREVNISNIHRKDTARLLTELSFFPIEKATLLRNNATRYFVAKFHQYNPVKFTCLAFFDSNMVNLVVDFFVMGLFPVLRNVVLRVEILEDIEYLALHPFVLEHIESFTLYLRGFAFASADFGKFSFASLTKLKKLNILIQDCDVECKTAATVHLPDILPVSLTDLTLFNVCVDLGSIVNLDANHALKRLVLINCTHVPDVELNKKVVLAQLFDRGIYVSEYKRRGNVGVLEYVLK